MIPGGSPDFQGIYLEIRLLASASVPVFPEMFLRGVPHSRE